MPNKIDFVAERNKKNVKANNVVEEKKDQSSIVEELKNLNNGEASIDNLTDEALQTIVGNIQLNDSEGRTIIFMSEEEAIIYAAQIQRNVPQIRFCKIVPCFSIYVGKFYVIEPMTTEMSNKFTEEELQSPADMVYVNSVILMAIAESCKREKERENKEVVRLDSTTKTTEQ